ncbi:unnamed protein product [Leptidea sinapis]|uniref:G-protein coupled receptors family 2 profile 2 domain-containing protein n=1 Tax=Leptidea sinapis TaxID=189913 RepID=A0A5E4QVE2_9NEOP|nr:unnamed protein product [Leptidea sinapis]
MYLLHYMWLFMAFVMWPYTEAQVGEIDLNDLSEQQNSVQINKCCEENQVMIDRVCRLAELYNESVWIPQFYGEDGNKVKVKYFRYILGVPNCATTEQRPIYDLGNSEDKLNLLSDGQLKHVIHHEMYRDAMTGDPLLTNSYGLHDVITIPEIREPSFYIHSQNKYCMDKILMTSSNKTGQYALVCIPEVKINWRDTGFLMKKVLNPMFHAIAMILFLSVAIIYFILPTLRDLAGNIITTINVCLIVSQAAGLVRIFTEFSNHVSFMITGAFFWLNSFGFYIWKTFKMAWYCNIFYTNRIHIYYQSIFLHHDAKSNKENKHLWKNSLQTERMMFLIMTLTWLFLLLSWLNFDGLLYAYVVVNLLQAILIFYVCIIRQSHIVFLLRKSCCYAEPLPTGEWGDEMTHMNGGNNYGY